jgi:hypothetical protein
VGLLYKGFEQYVPEPAVQEIREKEPVPEFVEEEEIKGPKPQRKSLFESFKTTIENIFDDDIDKKM